MKIVGIGAAGNKAVWNAVQLGAIDQNDILLMNSTTKDFPQEATDRCCLISNVGGCGKERQLGKEIMEEFLQNQEMVQKFFNNFVKEKGEHLVIVTSMAGGTGSGAANVLGTYCYEYLECDVTIIAFKGFGDDLRELENTIGFLKDLNKNFTVQIIDNGSFIKEANDNKVEAEKLANMQLAIRLNFLLGHNIVPSNQNIDATDHYKLVTTPGYQQIEYSVLKNIKNSENFAKTIKDMIDNSNGLPTIPSCTCFGIILNVNPETINYFDFSYRYLKDKYGQTVETYLHIQYTEDSGDDNEWIGLIVSGLKLPIKDLQEIYRQYCEYNEAVDKSEDSFFESVNNIQIDDSSKYNRGSRRNNRRKGGAGGFIKPVVEHAPSNGTFTPNEDNGVRDAY